MLFTCLLLHKSHKLFCDIYTHFELKTTYMRSPELSYLTVKLVNGTTGEILGQSKPINIHYNDKTMLQKDWLDCFNRALYDSKVESEELALFFYIGKKEGPKQLDLFDVYNLTF